MGKTMIIAMAVLAVAESSCAEKKQKVVEIGEDTILDNRVLTAEEQQSLSPRMVLDILRDGNRDFVSDNLTVRNNTERVRDAALGQYPKAVILSCVDSRVPVEDVFHRGIGDIFVVRVAGNVVNDDILGSLEYACKVSGARLVVVMGHEYCGAIKSAIKGVEIGNITGLLRKIEPAIDEARAEYTAVNATDKNESFVEAVCLANVEHGVREIRAKSGILADMERDGDIMIVGAVYDMHTGVVEFYEGI